MSSSVEHFEWYESSWDFGFVEDVGGLTNIVPVYVAAEAHIVAKITILNYT